MSFTLVQSSTLARVGTGVNTQNLTVTSTGSGHLLVVLAANDNGTANYLTGVTGGGTWVVPSSAQISDVNWGALSCAYVLASASGATTISLTYGATTGHYTANFWEYSFTGSSVSLDKIGTVDQGFAASPQLGVALTLTGTNDVILQASKNNNDLSSISSPYGNFQHLLGVGVADSENTVSGTAPSWSMTGSSRLGGMAIAFSEVISATSRELALLGVGN